MLDRYRLIDDEGPEMMQPYIEVVGSRPGLMIRGNFNTTAVIFKSVTRNLGHRLWDLRPGCLRDLLRDDSSVDFFVPSARWRLGFVGFG